MKIFFLFLKVSFFLFYFNTFFYFLFYLKGELKGGTPYNGKLKQVGEDSIFMIEYKESIPELIWKYSGKNIKNLKIQFYRLIK